MVEGVLCYTHRCRGMQLQKLVTPLICFPEDSGCRKLSGIMLVEHGNSFPGGGCKFREVKSEYDEKRRQSGTRAGIIYVIAQILLLARDKPTEG